MTIDLNDPRLTAYALGELSEAERGEVESALAESPAARADVEKTRELTGLLTSRLKSEVAPKFDGERKDQIRAGIAPDRRGLWSHTHRLIKPMAAIAASVVLLVGAASFFLPTLSRARNLRTFGSTAALRSTGSQYLAHKAASPSASDRWEGLGAWDQLARRNEAAFDAGSKERRACTGPDWNTESYQRIEDNPFLTATQNPLSTFSIDVDTASYANVRRFLNAGRLPPPDAVRIEELLNYFTYDYPPPAGGDEAAPFSANMEVAECPWSPTHRLVRIGLKGRTIASDRRPKSNLVFLIDVSGSMDEPNKLPLVKRAMQMLTSQLGESDRVAMVVYAGSSGLVLPSTTADHTQAIMNAIENLSAGGSTNGGEGINLAYDIAQQYFVKGGVNRVILCTDGDFNVGVTSPGDLTRLIEEKAKSGVFLSVFGFGMGNLKDSTLESLADKGNGNYGYIDTLNEARKVFVEQLSGTLVTIAKDVKIQVEFNPAKVAAYRLIGYENRLLRAEDFNNDQKDAGEIGAGHTVTALYELVPVGQPIASGVDPLKYQQPPATAVAATGSNESLTLKLRYKQPDGETSKLLEFPSTDSGKAFAQASPDFQFAAAVAGFGMQLRNSPHKGSWTLNAVREVAQQNRAADPFGYRAEFTELVGKARGLVAR